MKLLEPTPDLVMDAVSDALGIDVEDMLSSSQMTSVKRARRVAMTVARWTTGRSYLELARHFRRWDHTTVMSAVRHVEANERDRALAERIAERVERTMTEEEED